MKIRRYRWVWLLPCLWWAGDLHAQEQPRDTLAGDTVRRVAVTLQGQVVGCGTGQEKETLPGAYIYIGDEQTPVTTTDAEGRFSLPRVPVGKVQVGVSYIGYERLFFYLDLEKDTDLGEICLKSVLLDEVLVEAKVPLAVQHGDTTKFNAEAVVLAPDADLEAFIKKLPGFEIINGKIMAQGKEVTHLYIDGQEYAFNNPGMALKDLPAKLVKKLAVFDKRSEEAEFSGYDDGKRYRSLNIETHEPNRAKVFGYGDAAYGISSPVKQTFRENSYSGNLSGSYFASQHKITCGADARNTGMRVDFPESLFGGGNAYSRGGGGHVNVSSQIGEKWDLSGNYRLGKNASESASKSKQEYFPTDRYQTRLFDSEGRSRSEDWSHSVNAHAVWKADRKNRLSFSTWASWGDSKGHSLDYTGNVEDGDTVNVARSASGNEGKRMNWAGDISYMTSFAKQGRTADLSLQGSCNRTLADQSRHHREHALQETGGYSDTVRHLRIGNKQNGFDFSVSGNWTEPLTEHARVVFRYAYRINRDHSSRNSLAYRDEAFGELLGVDSSQTNALRNAYRVHAYGINYSYAKDDLMFSGGLSVDQTRMDNRYRYLGQGDSTVVSRYADLSPMLNFGMGFEENRHLDINYSGHSSSPSVTQLQDVLDVANPLQVSKGNPGLKKSYSHNFSVSYIYTGLESSTYLSGTLHFSQTFNGISTNTKFIARDTVVNGYLLKRGASLSMPVNLNGNRNIGINVSYAFPWKKLKSNIHTTTGYGFSRSPSIYDDLKNMNSSHTGHFSGHFLTNFSEDFDCSLAATQSLSFSRNTETGNARQFNTSLDFNLSWVFWQGFYARLRYAALFNIQSRGDRVRQREHTLDFEIGKKFGRERRMKIYVSADDLLRNRRTVQFSLSDLYSSISYRTLPTAFLKIGFTYRFDNIRR